MKKEHNFLFVTVDGGGNIPPVLGLARRLAQRGHKVRVLTEPCLEAPVKAYGLTYLPFQEHFTRTDRKEDICKDWNDSPFSPPSTFESIVFGPAKMVMAETVQALQQEPTDVLVVDCLLPPALMAGEHLQVPRVALFHMPEYFPGPNRPPGVMGLMPGKGLLGRFRDRLLGKLFYRVLNKYLPKINEVRKPYRLPPLQKLSDLIFQADRRFIQTARAFDFPIEPAPQQVRYTGPVLDDPDWAQPWENPWPEEDSRPLVVVSLSSTFQNQMGAIQNCIDALRGLPVRGLVTLGLALDHEQFAVPENIKVVPSAPHSQVFPQANLVISHAGHGTIMRALAHGLPLICLPMGRDQNDNAAKVAFHGCGLRLSSKATPATIRGSIQRILHEPRFRQQAARLQQEIMAASTQDTAIAELENLASNKRQAPVRQNQNEILT